MGGNKIIGGKIREIRESKKITQEEVAERAGLSVRQIEMIEEDVTLPSLAPLIKIARVLGVRLGTFMDDQTELGPVIHRGQLASTEDTINFSNDSSAGHKHMEYHALSQDKSGRHMEPFLIDICVGTGDEEYALSTHEGEEFIYVLGGIVEVCYGKHKYLLEAGDSIYYDSIVPHHVHVANEGTARILGVIYTPY